MPTTKMKPKTPLPKNWDNLTPEEQQMWVYQSANKMKGDIETWAKTVKTDIDANRDAYRNGSLGFQVTDDDMDAVINYADKTMGQIDSAVEAPDKVLPDGVTDKWTRTTAMEARRRIDLYTSKLNFRPEPTTRLLKRINKDNWEEQADMNWMSMYKRSRNHAEWISKYGYYSGPQPEQVVEQNTPKMKPRTK